ncbi:MAG: glycerophosphodiester phosphodiesterase [Clostridiales Family XIII bacterium]|jgi:glycerophosphoryl diester phosphodiesterase|nr:glycerophosphodiester phosphodiesterase [Clostridiales Family XIII bacterium]
MSTDERISAQGGAWLRTRPVAHRGLHDGNRAVPENSMAAFRAAAAAWHPIETDVQLTKDGWLVCFHDFDLMRMTGAQGFVRERTLAELRELRLAKTTEAIPTLEELLETVGDRVPLLIEIKNDGRAGLLEDRLCGTLYDCGRRYGTVFAVQSFNPFSLARVRKNRPEILRGQLCAWFTKNQLPLYKRVPLRRFRLNFLSKPDFISYAIGDLPNPQVAAFRAAGLPVLGWTARTEAEREKAARYCDNIIFE